MTDEVEQHVADEVKAASAAVVPAAHPTEGGSYRRHPTTGALELVEQTKPASPKPAKE